MEKPHGSESVYRCERKFATRDLTRKDVEHLIRHHPAVFAQRYSPRWVNNCYLDSHRMDAYWENVDGVMNRVKVRVRWYGALFGDIPHSSLEFKIKKGSVGRKDQYRLGAFKLNNTFDHETLKVLFAKSQLPTSVQLHLQCMEPVLMNRYRRSYLESFDRKWRLTVDTDLQYFAVWPNRNTFCQTVRDQELVVLELKHSPADDEQASTITRFLPLHLTRNSKYVSGIAQAYA